MDNNNKTTTRVTRVTTATAAADVNDDTLSQLSSKCMESMVFKKSSQLNSFLSKTYHMVNGSDSSIVSWSDLGDSFTIYDVEAFEKTILPSYFSHSKYASFVRQLNFYGFRKLRKNHDVALQSSASDAIGRASLSSKIPSVSSSSPSWIRFSHPYFQKDRGDLLFKIKRATDPSLHHDNNINKRNILMMEKKDEEIENLKHEITQVKKDMEIFKLQMQQQMHGMVQQMESCQMQLSRIPTSYKCALARALQAQPKPPPTTQLATLHMQQFPTNLSNSSITNKNLLNRSYSNNHMIGNQNSLLQFYDPMLLQFLSQNNSGSSNLGYPSLPHNKLLSKEQEPSSSSPPSQK